MIPEIRANGQVKRKPISITAMMEPHGPFSIAGSGPAIALPQKEAMPSEAFRTVRVTHARLALTWAFMVHLMRLHDTL